MASVVSIGTRSGARRHWLTVALLAAIGGVAGIFASIDAPPLSLTWILLFVLIGAAIVRPDFALRLLIPVLYLIPFAIAPVRVGAQPPIVELSLAAIALGFISRPNSIRELRSAFSVSRQYWWVAALLAAGSISTLVSMARSADPAQLQYAAKLGIGVFAFYLTSTWGISRAFRSSVMGAIVISGAAQSALATAMYLRTDWAAWVFGLAETIGYPDASSAVRFLPDGETVRAVGTAVDPNVLGAMLAVALAAGTARASTSRGGAIIIWLAASAAIVPGLALSLSRGAWLGAGAGVLIALWVRSPRSAVALAVAGLAVVSLPTRIPLLEHLRAGLMARDPASVLRLRELREVPAVIGDSPVFGVGFITESVARYSLQVSNSLLWIAERTGLLGGILYLGAVVDVLYSSGRRIRAHPERAAALAGFAAALVTGFFDHHIASIPHMVALFWLLAGILVGSMVAERVPSRN